MRFRLLIRVMAGVVAAVGSAAYGQNTPTGNVTTGVGPYIPGVTYQADNPNYLNRSPFYFEGRVDWNLLHIEIPSTPWEYTQRGIHFQDDLQDNASAIADYQAAISMNNLTNGSCQLITTGVQATLNPALDPPPCMFTPRTRLAHLLIGSQPDVAIGIYEEVLQIDALRLGINAFIGEAWENKAAAAADDASRNAALKSAVAAYQSELALSPVTAQYTALTGDKANNAHVHWSLARIYGELGDIDSQAAELQAYLDATQWHSDTYAWRIPLAKERLAKLKAALRVLHAPVDQAK